MSWAQKVFETTAQEIETFITSLSPALQVTALKFVIFPYPAFLSTATLFSIPKRILFNLGFMSVYGD